MIEELHHASSHVRLVGPFDGIMLITVVVDQIGLALEPTQSDATR